MTWSIFASGFLMGMFKFLFAATYLKSVSQLEVLDIFFLSLAGALTSFNLFYWLSGYFMKLAKKRRLQKIKEGTYKKKKFTWLNKNIVKIKLSSSGIYLLSTLGVLFMSLPIGGIVLSKFYGEKKVAYFIGNSTIIISAYLLAYFNDFIFGLF